ncbi:MAG: hypothetical protein WDA03_12145 [Trueperaceae bacterium]|jgi:hypothetical protein
MTFLAAIPIWVYFIILAITFMVVHVMALRANQPENRARSVGGRIASSLILLAALVFLDPAQPASVLVALFAAALAGFVSGRTATPPLPPRAAKSEDSEAE